MPNHAKRAEDLAKAVHLLRKHGMTVGFPMQTADGEIIFAVDKDSTLTAGQILELLERGELHAEGVRKLVEVVVAAVVGFRTGPFHLDNRISEVYLLR